jgi:peroxiredoxin
MRSVQYLAGAALQLEAASMEDLAQATLDSLAKRFADPDSELGREVRVAVAAREARRNILGVRFNPQLSAIDGTSIAMDSYLGRVVLVPFWSAAFPESLQLMGAIKELQASLPQDVAIVGVNLDGNDSLLQEFLDKSDLGFPSFRAKSSADAEVANAFAAQFGMASMPFLAILGRDGKVAALNFTGKGIRERVDQLLSE